MRSAGITGQALTAARAGAVVVTANTRAARNLRLHYAWAQDREGRLAWPSAQIHSWRAWTKQLWQEWLLGAEGEVPVLLDVGQEAQLWQQAMAAGGRGTAPGMNLPAAATLAARAWRLAWHYGLPLTHPTFRARPDSAAFRAWAQAFQKKCEQNHWLDEARLPGFLGERIAAGQLAPPPRVLLVGFDELAPQQAALLGAAAARGMAWSEAAPGPEGEAVCVEAPDAAGEIAAAARWARRLLERDPAARIAVVVPELDALRSRVERAFLEALQPQALAAGRVPGRRLFDLSLGRPLAEYPLIAAAFTALRLALGPLPMAEAGRLLRSPFLAGSEEEHVARAQMDARLRRQGRFEVALDELRGAAGRGCPQLAKRLGWLRKARRALPAAASPSQWADKLSRLLHFVGWPGERAQSSEERQTLERWRRLLAGFSRLGLVRPSMSAAEALVLLAEMAARQIFQPENEGAPVQIVGMLEAAGSEFDSMWVMGMHDGAWPSAARPDPFLPFALQRERGLPGASPPAQLELARRITRRLRASAGRVVFSHAAADSENRLRPSPLPAECGAAEATLDEVAPGPEATWARALLDPGALEPLPDEPAPALPAGPAPGGTRLLKLQSDCPFRAFAELRLGADELDTPQPGLDPRRRGSVLHRALENVWRELGSHQRLLEVRGEERRRLAGECVKEALDKKGKLGGTEWERRFRDLEQERVTALVEEWLSIEETRAPFRVAAQEEKRPATVGGLTFNIQADRVDELEDGGRVLLDYKTTASAPKVKGWEGTRPDEPQLPVYAATLEAEVAAVAFAWVRRGESKFIGHARGHGLLPAVKRHESAAAGTGLEPLVAQWRQALEGLAEGFRSGQAAVDPHHGATTCKYCHLPGLCRIGELDRLRPAEDGEEEEGGDDDR